jgi:hypothetical protein
VGEGVISQSQGFIFYSTEHHREIREEINASRWIRTRDSSLRAAQDSVRVGSEIYQNKKKSGEIVKTKFHSSQNQNKLSIGRFRFCVRTDENCK